MAGSTRVGDYLASNFAGILLANRKNVVISATGDIIIAPSLVAGIGIPYTQYRVRKIVCRNALVSGVTGDVSACNLGVWDAAAQGGNNIVANGALTGLTGSTKYFELTITATGNNTVITSGTLFVNVGTGVANGTVDIDIYGDVVVGRE